MMCSRPLAADRGAVVRREVAKRKRRAVAASRKAGVKAKKPKTPAVSRFRVYQPKPKPKPEPNGKRFQTYQAKPATRDPDPPPEPRVSRFNVYQPKAPAIERYKPNGSSWIELDGYWCCEYGCKTFKVKEAPSGVNDNDYHAYDCPYWYEAGINETPF